MDLFQGHLQDFSNTGKSKTEDIFEKLSNLKKTFNFIRRLINFSVTNAIL